MDDNKKLRAVARTGDGALYPVALNRQVIVRRRHFFAIDGRGPIGYNSIYVLFFQGSPAPVIKVME